eukprot:PhF_6_TR36556/c1_g2_i4/m.53964
MLHSCEDDDTGVVITCKRIDITASIPSGCFVGEVVHITVTTGGGGHVVVVGIVTGIESSEQIMFRVLDEDIVSVNPIRVGDKVQRTRKAYDIPLGPFYAGQCAVSPVNISTPPSQSLTTRCADSTWQFTPSVSVGDYIRSGDVIGGVWTEG